MTTDIISLPQLSVVNKPHGNGQAWTMWSSTPDGVEYPYTLQAIIDWSWEGGGTTRVTWHLHEEGQDFRIYRDNFEFIAARQTVADHEGEEAALEWETNHWTLRHVNNHGFSNVEARMADILRRWEALRLLVNPAVHL